MSFELHGFADASLRAYAAAIYFRVVSADGVVSSGLLTSKSRVAPIKSMTVPRLELSAALLLAKLMDSVLKTLGDRDITVHFWGDSTIVLSWLKKEPCEFREFVEHRVANVQEITTKHNAMWHHVPTATNPADIASRGCIATDLLENSLWWDGPDWLRHDKSEWPTNPCEISEAELLVAQLEERPRKVAVATPENYWLLNDYESVSRLNLVTAFGFRFINKMKAAVALRKAGAGLNKPTTITPIGNLMERVEPVRLVELLQAEAFWCKLTQASAYAEELKCLRNGKLLPRKSSLTALAPFIDDWGLIRVGGRLCHAMMSYDEKHSVILPGNSMLAKKLITKSHLSLLHGGNQVVTRHLRQKFWIIGGRNAIRSGLFDCVRCKPLRKQPGVQQMAPLVPSRVNVSETFAVVSIDYAGPFEAKRWVNRCKTKVKIYVCAFRCMSTRAIHLEVVDDLTTTAFIDAYQRFAARRGHCRKIISDNATTFVSAKRNMNEMLEIWRKCAHLSTFTSRGIEWQFIMPASPHQGGSHESAVKSFKTHFKRVVKNEKLSV